MRVHVNHTTTYNYTEPQRMIIQSHRLIPAECNSQQIISWNINCQEAVFGSAIIDGAGDQIQTMCVENLQESVEIQVVGEVETSDTNGVIKLQHQTVSPLVYLRDTALTKADQRLRDLAQETAANISDGPLSLAHAMMGVISDAFAYTSGATNSSYTASEALEQGSGVCQDYAHSLISIARVNQIPARYVTGYLHTDSDGRQHEASHAWAELYIDGLGWVGFDATNNCCPDQRYIRIGSGLDAQDGALIRGISRGGGEESMATDVSIGDVQQ